MMKLLRNFLLTLVMAYSLVSNQVAAAQDRKDGEQGSPQTRQRLTDGQNEGSSLREKAIQLYAQYYGPINFAILAVTATAATYGASSFAHYIDQSQQRQLALYNERRERFASNCNLIAKECNGTSISLDSCQANLGQSMCYNILFECVSRLCGWDLLFVRSPDNKSAQFFVHTYTCS